MSINTGREYGTGEPRTEYSEPEQQRVPVDYFGFQATERFTFPDGVQWFDIEIMNEGKKLKFQKNTSRDLIVDKRSGDARMKMDPGTERHELIRSSVTNWNLFRQGQPVMFTERNMRDFLDLADPRLVEKIEQKIRDLNPWLLNDMTVEQVDEEIDRLNQMRRDIINRESGNESSTSK